MTDVKALTEPLLVNPDRVAMSPWTGTSVIEGNPHQEFSILFRGGSEGSNLWSAIWSTEPCTLRFAPKQDCLMYVIEGDADVDLEDGETCKVSPGSIVAMPKGRWTTWRVNSFLREFVTYY